MIYLIYGTDRDKARKKAWSIIDSLIAKHKDASFIKLTEQDEVSQSRINELTSGQALFFNKFIVLMQEVFLNDESKESITKNLKDISSSENIFILLEEKIDAKTLKKIESVGGKCQEFEKSDMTKKEKLAQIGEKIDFFEFTDTLGSRNKKKLWHLFQDALIEQVPAEEVHGIFFWEIKSMLLTLKCKDAQEAGMKPYPFQKTKEHAKKYTLDELISMSENLASMYHEAHRGNTDLYIELEKFILSL